ncbi:MAG: hypothetical protein LUI07_08150 [Lachnospiraceae bacterium]|nr:hypothetical protein [Lachnospiraceae bacterium]
MKKGWKKFAGLTSQGYSDLIAFEPSLDAWNNAFEVLLENIADERAGNADYAKELYQVDDSTDYRYDVSEWLEDYLDELDMREEYERLETACRKLLTLFAWEEESPSEFCTMLSVALLGQGKTQEALTFDEEWLQKEPDSQYAVAALIRARMKCSDMQGARELVEGHITEATKCIEDNELIFIAAEEFYQEAGEKKAAKRVHRELEAFEELLDDEFDEEFGGEFLEDEDDLADMELPFN